MKSIPSLLFGSLLLATGPSMAQPPAGFMPDGIDYDRSISTPAEALGHELGQQPARYDPVIGYFTTLAEASDRVAIETLGHSIEGRPIVLLKITSPANHARLETIRTRHLAATGDESADVEKDLPAVVWLGFGVHGAEAAGLEAALPLAHHLAAGQGAAIDQMLKHSVVLIAAALNPDGHARRINDSLRFLSHTVVRNGDHAGHKLWTRQRANHYGFDLNRQWLLLAQPEPRVWVPAWHRWQPHLSADFHEMGTTSVRPSTFFFSPGDALRANRLIPEFQRPLHRRIAAYHQAVLDKRGTLYFTEEVYNSFYPGSGSGYPNLHGGIGTLFEVGTAHLVELDTPLGRWSLAENIEVHFHSALSAIAAAVELRAELADYRQRFYQDSRDRAARDPRGGFVFTSPDRTRLARFVELLRSHRIEVHRLDRDIEIDGQDFPANQAWIVALAQDHYPMVRAVFDRVTEFDKPAFADVNGWTLPLAWNLDYAAVPRGRMDNTLLGTQQGPDPTRFEPPEPANYGYVFAWDDENAPRALHRLLDAGVVARAATGPMHADTRNGPVQLGRGAVFVPLKGQTLDPARLHELVGDIGEEIEIHAVDTGRTLDEGADFGSGRAFGTLRSPRVLLLFEDGIQRFDMGHVWHLLDRVVEMPVVLKQKQRIGEIDWSRYTHIILPGGRGVGLNEAATERVRQWITGSGGTFIAIRQGAEWAQQALLDRQPQTDRTLQLTTEEKRFDYHELRLRQARDVVSGAIFASDLDLSHPLAFGYHRRMLPSHRDTALVLATPDNPVATVARYHADPLLAGYASERRRREIGGSPMLIAERLGQGSVILMADNPDFRGAWPGTRRLLLNSLFFSHLFSAPANPGGARYRP
ncbi:MAG: hypothetical protein LC637_00805 [Xanthomonadaceae bacterium]|nr:hypothetical protein [Xanthomonadaceae bacterium]